MSIIERDFVQDNGTVKENNYKTKYYVRGEDTKNYRRIGDIPVSGNYELNLPYPLDSRMLVPTEECLTNIEWWRTAFGIDTIIYKGMLVTCIETHKTYIYDGPTVKLTVEIQEDQEQEYLTIENWKKQRIDKSLVKWPIDVNDEEIIRIGADIVNPLDEKDDGLYITKNSDLLGAGLYINDKFISIGKNSRRDTNIYPFVPYDMVENFSETISESTFNEAYTNTQMGIYIPTSTDPTVADHQLCIYSANGINLNNTDDSNTIILNSEFIKFALEKDDNIYLTVFCENCEYKLKVLPGGEMKPITNFVQAPQIRKLAQEGAPLLGDLEPSPNNRIYFFIADGISALFVAFIMIFVSLIGCLIMMNIYVHNTALVEQPLKLGRIEA